VQIGCTISKHHVVVDETLVFTAFQKPEGVPVAFAFNHGDGTIDRTNESHAYYAEAGRYDVNLLWQHAGGKGSTQCGTVTVSGADPIFNEADYLGHSRGWAEAVAYNAGFQSRVVRIDDEWLIVTTDYWPDRVNFEIDNNIVTKATLG